MNPETLTKTQSEQSLTARIAELVPKRNETREALLGRIAVIAEDEFGDHELSADELDYAHELLDIWYFSQRRLRGQKFRVGQRMYRPDQRQQAVIQDMNYRAPRGGLIIPDLKGIVLMVEEPFTGGDLADLIRIEQNSNASMAAPATPPPKLSRASKNKEQKEQVAERAELHQVSSLLLTATDKSVLNLQALRPSKISTRIDGKNSAISKQFIYALNRNVEAGTCKDRAEFLTKAVDGGLVDMSLLPARRDYLLTEIEQKLVTGFVFADRATTMDEIGLESQEEVTEIRRTICEKIGTSRWSSNRVFLTLKRDGVV